MSFPNVPFKSYCWSLGTTSFRTENFNVNIEAQLQLLAAFKNKEENQFVSWRDCQERYYDFMKENDFVTGDAPRKDKDAREKTSGLVDIGLLDDERNLTEAGLALLEVSLKGDFSSDNELQIPKDSYIYLKQLLKTSNKVGDSVVRPLIVLIFFLLKMGYLTVEEFAYVLPLCIDKAVTQQMLKKILEYRQGLITLDDILVDVIFSMDNYIEAFDLFMENEVTEDLICVIGLNRKSRQYDRAYFPFYRALREVCLRKDYSKVIEVYSTLRRISTNPAIQWRKYLFRTFHPRTIANCPEASLNKVDIFNVTTEDEFKRLFFEKLHLFKIRSTLYDYFDLNRRYFQATDTVLFQDGKITLDLIPKYFFLNIIDELFDEEAFKENDKLQRNCPMSEIADCLIFDEAFVFSRIEKELGIKITTSESVKRAIISERHGRFNRLIDQQFDDNVLIRLLDMFEHRQDEEIRRLVTDNADIPTIFEYILGIIWYKVSERKGNILEFMKLSLDANLLPKSHAVGGSSDIEYYYEETSFYPEHYLLVEATLCDALNQRRLEMEPVSRHLGEHLLRTSNHFSYCLFISTYLDNNVVSDFRNRKSYTYFSRDGSKSVKGFKIIPIKTKELKTIIKNGLTYKMLHPIFDEAFNSKEPILNWYSRCIENKLQ